MKKMCIKIISIIAIILCTSGCGNKTPINTNTFASVLGSKEYEIVDLSKQYSSNQNIKNVIIAKNVKNYQIEFYTLSDEETAMNLYNENYANFQSVNSSSQIKKSGDNYSKYTLTTDNYYLVVSRVANTLIYIEAPILEKDFIDSILKELDY